MCRSPDSTQGLNASQRAHPRELLQSLHGFIVSFYYDLFFISVCFEFVDLANCSPRRLGVCCLLWMLIKLVLIAQAVILPQPSE